ncbi:MAG: hypothetical protein ACRDP2_15485 [Nocardioidaceae bacterium]
MAAKVCQEITEWIEEQVSKPIEEWEERQEERCKNEKCKWWMLCLNKLVCWFVTILVKVVRWVVVTVGKWVTRTVCTVISVLVDVLVAVGKGLYEMGAGIVTWDWSRVWWGFVGILGGLVQGVVDIFRVITLGDTVDFIREEINRHRLRDYVRDLLHKRFARDPDGLAAALDAIGVDHGAFGLRIKGVATRTFVRSDRTDPDGGVPQLVQWHEDASLDIDIRKLAGYDYDSFWKRNRPEVDGADEDDIDAYIRDRGGKSFRIYAMSDSLLGGKASTAAERSRALGLMLELDTEEVEVTAAEDVRLSGSSAVQDEFNVDVLARHDERTDSATAIKELPAPIGGGVFGYRTSHIGYSSHLNDSVCLDGDPFPGSFTSGVSFQDLQPDLVFTYVLIHELGHYFGLCHVDGANRIMYTSNKDEAKTWWSWSLLPEYLWLEGRPRFVLDEAKRAWDYIVAGFPTEALTTRAH